MKNTLKLVFTITIIILCFMFTSTVTVNAKKTLKSITFIPTRNAIIGDSFITSGDASFSEAEIVKYYKSNDLSNPTNEVSINGSYEENTDYIVQIKITPRNGYVAFSSVSLSYNGESEGEYIGADDSGAIIANFKVPIYCKVDFNVSGGSFVSSQVIKKGGEINWPNDPTRDGYSFAGWYKDKDYNEKFYPDSEISNNTILYAKWDKILKEVNATVKIPEPGKAPDFNIISDDTSKYKVSDSYWYLYEDPYPHLSESDVFESGKAYSLRVIFNLKDGYVVDDNTVFKINGVETSCYGSNVNRELTFYIHTIQFDSNDGNEISNQELYTSSKIVKPENPTREGYVFEGWYTDSELKEQYDFNTPVNNNIKLYAKWTKIINISSFTLKADRDFINPKVKETIEYPSIVRVDTSDPSGIENEYKINYVWYDETNNKSFYQTSEDVGVFTPGKWTLYVYVKVPNYNYVINHIDFIQNENLSNINLGGKKFFVAAHSDSYIGYSTSFKILNSINSTKITGIINKTYNGKKQTQNVTIVYDNKELINGIDYKIEYKNNENVGEAKIIIKGIGNYNGVVEKVFKIVKANNTMVVKTKNKKVKYKKVKKKKQKITAITVKNNQGKVTYSKVSGNKRIKVNKHNGKITIKKKTKKGTYKIKIKVNATGNSNYNSGYKIVTVKIKVK